MAKTRDELIALSKNWLGLSDTTDKDTLMQDLLNFIQTEIARVHAWRCLRVKATGVFAINTKSYTWTGLALTNVHLLFLNGWKITGANARVLTRIPEDQADALYPDPATLGSTGVPAYYADKGAVGIELLPIPDAAYPWELYYLKWPTELTTGGQTSDLLRMDDLLVYMLNMHTAGSLGLLQDFNHWKTVVFNEYPLGSGRKRGLLPQLIADDDSTPDLMLVRRPFSTSGLAKPPNYLSRPDIAEVD